MAETAAAGKITPADADILLKSKPNISEIFKIDNSNTLVWDGYKPDGTKNQYWDKGKSIDYKKHLEGLSQGGNPAYKNEKGEWVARPDREELHNMRVKMEKYEEENDTISIAAPLSAFKMLKENVTPIEDFVNSSDKPLSKNQTMTLNAEYFGLQVLNPSNKMEIVDPTQIKTLITGEQSDDVEVIIGGNKVKLGDIRERYHKGVSDRVTQKYQDKRNLIFTFDVDYAMNELHTSIEENKITVDLLNYLEYAQTSLESSQSAAEIIEYF